MNTSLYILKPVRYALVAAITIMMLPHYSSADTKPTPQIVGVIDDDKLFQARSDYPLLTSRVIAPIVAQRHLSLVVSKRGLKWSASQQPRVDITADVLARLKKLPPNATALTGAQYAAAQKALAALNALRVATEGDIAIEEYKTRLTDCAIACDANLRLLPPGPLHDKLSEATQDYHNTLATLDQCATANVYATKLVELQYERQRMQIPEQLAGALFQLEQKEKADLEQATAKSYQPFYDAISHIAEVIRAAEALMPQPPQS